MSFPQLVWYLPLLGLLPSMGFTGNYRLVFIYPCGENMPTLDTALYKNLPLPLFSVVIKTFLTMSVSAGAMSAMGLPDT